MAIQSYKKNGKTLFRVWIKVRDSTGRQMTKEKSGIATEKESRNIEFELRSELKGRKQSYRWRLSLLRPAPPTKKNLFSRPEVFDLKSKDAKNIFAELKDKVSKWRRYYKYAGLSADDIEFLEPAFNWEGLDFE